YIAIFEIRTWGMSSQLGLEVLNRQKQLAEDIFNNMQQISPWKSKVNFSPVVTQNENVVGIYIDAAIELSGAQLEELPRGIDPELLTALYPAWVAWNLADPSISEPFDGVAKLLGVAGDLIIEGINWQSAIAMAEIEIAQV